MEEVKKCSFCGEEILAVAIKCKHCGEFLNQNKKTDDVISSTIAETTAKRTLSDTFESDSIGRKKGRIGVFIGLIIMILGAIFNKYDIAIGFAVLGLITVVISYLVIVYHKT